MLWMYSIGVTWVVKLFVDVMLSLFSFPNDGKEKKSNIERVEEGKMETAV
jgi:hypothetical protein